MKIERVEVRNFRGLTHFEFSPGHCHVLVGENGCGKTAVLEALRLATNTRIAPTAICEQDFNTLDAGDVLITVQFDSYFLAIVEDGFASHKVPCSGVALEIKRRNSATKGKVLSDPFVVSQSCIPVAYSNPLSLSRPLPDSVQPTSLPPTVDVTDDLIKIGRKNGSTRDLRRGALNLSLDLVGYPNIFFFDRRREREATHGFGTLLTRIARELNWRYRKKWDSETTEKAWSEYYDLTVGVVQDRKGKRVLEPLRKRLTDLLKRDYSNLELSLLTTEEPFSNSFLSLRSGLNQIAMDGFGSGEAVVTAYCLLEHMSRLSGEQVIFLIDEPELHLHPQVQRRLSADFRDSPHQIILTTHSPRFASFADWRCTTRMFRGECYPDPAVLARVVHGASLAEHLDEIRTWRQDRTVFSDADPEIFFAQRVLLVEGPVDHYGMEVLPARLGLDWSDITVVPCGGKNKLPYYAMIAAAYGVPAFAIFDLDGKSLSHQENDGVVSRLMDVPYAYFANSFEDAIGCKGNQPHKASRAIQRIDTMSAADIIPEIRTLIETIDTWRSPPMQ